MTAERFAQLVAAYGADHRRWPEGEREGAQAFAASDADMARPMLAEADAVDALLFASRTQPVSAALRDRVVAAATTTGTNMFRVGRWVIDRFKLAIGVGWAAAACAGIVAGAMLTGQQTADLQGDAALYEAYMFALDDDEVRS